MAKIGNIENMKAWFFSCGAAAAHSNVAKFSYRFMKKLVPLHLLLLHRTHSASTQHVRNHTWSLCWHYIATWMAWRHFKYIHMYTCRKTTAYTKSYLAVREPFRFWQRARKKKWPKKPTKALISIYSIYAGNQLHTQHLTWLSKGALQTSTKEIKSTTQRTLSCFFRILRKPVKLRVW